MLSKSANQHFPVFFPEGAGKRALITGAGRGIGRTIALHLAQAGVDCTIVARTESDLQACALEAAELGATVKPRVAPCDLADAQACAKLAEHVADDDQAPISVLIHAAGIAQSAPIKRSSDQLFDRTMAVNARAFHTFLRTLSPAMTEQGFGRCIAIGSVAGLRGYPYVSAYCASKHALIGLVRSAAKELGGKGICVNAICPGYVDTPMTQNTLDVIAQKTGRSIGEARGELEAMSPQKRLFSPAEIAATAFFLLSAGAAGINGQAIPVCGGEIA